MYSYNEIMIFLVVYSSSCLLLISKFEETPTTRQFPEMSNPQDVFARKKNVLCDTKLGVPVRDEDGVLP